MGEKNSTDTRVVPVFDELLALSPPQWLQRLVALASPAHANFAEGPLVGRGWGDDERGLLAPSGLLRRLVEDPNLLVSPPPADLGSKSPSVQLRRRELLARDQSRRDEALRLLGRPRPPTRAWYVFEGETWPDVFVETEHVVLVIEGKRTERDVTQSTTWMPIRHQMLRHLDAVFEIAAGRQVVGMFIVEGERPDASVVPSHWVTKCATTTDPAVLDNSLPHRTGADRRAIANAYAGVTTWQALLREFYLPSSLLP